MLFSQPGLAGGRRWRSFRFQFVDNNAGTVGLLCCNGSFINVWFWTQNLWVQVQNLWVQSQNLWVQAQMYLIDLWISIMDSVDPGPDINNYVWAWVMCRVMCQEITLLRPRHQQWMLWAWAHTSIFAWAWAQTPIMEGLGLGPDGVWVFILYCVALPLFLFCVSLILW